MRELFYNRQWAVNYARVWAYSRNPRFYDFSDLGGDCTNFASQCIFAGAGVMNYTPEVGWFYIDANDRSPSWTGVEFLYDFLVNNLSVGPYGREASTDEVLPGDVVQLADFEGDFYHTLVIVATMPQILVAAHSRNVLNKPLEDYNFDSARFIHIEGVRTW